jgi:hypothetical protein
LWPRRTDLRLLRRSRISHRNGSSINDYDYHRIYNDENGERDWYGDGNEGDEFEWGGCSEGL